MPSPCRETPGERSTRALWITRGNYRAAPEIERVRPVSGPAPLAYPWSALGGREPIILPPHAGDIECSVHLAAVVGKPAYRLESADAAECLAGYALMLHLLDRSLEEDLESPTDYERRAAYFLGGCADGFCRVGPFLPGPPASFRADMPMLCRLDGGPAVGTSPADYLEGMGRLLEMLTRSGTLLPGDVVSLGPAGPRLCLPAGDALRPGAKVTIAAWSAGEASWPVEDRRRRDVRLDNSRHLRP